MPLLQKIATRIRQRWPSQLFTTDLDVARKYDMHDEREFFGDDWEDGLDDSAE